MTYSALSSTSFQARLARPRVTANVTTKLPNVSKLVIYVTLACLLIMVYLVQVTKVDANGYQVNDLQVKAAALKEQNNDLVLANAQLQSLDRVENSDVATAMVETTPANL